MTPESRLRDAIKRRIDNLRSAGLSIKYLKIHGGPMIEAGTPDVLVVLDGRAFFFEAKVKPNKATKLQEQRIKEWESAGATACVVHSVEDVDKVLFGGRT